MFITQTFFGTPVIFAFGKKASGQRKENYVHNKTIKENFSSIFHCYGAFMEVQCEDFHDHRNLTHAQWIHSYFYLIVESF